MLSRIRWTVRGLTRTSSHERTTRKRAFLQLEALERREVPASYTVNAFDDRADANVGDGLADVDLNTPGLQTTLRAALQEANARPANEASTITIPAGIVVLQSALPSLDRNITINGAGGTGQTEVERAGTLPQPPAFRIFDVPLEKTCTISGMTISNGKVINDVGAGIKNFGTLTLYDLTVTANQATATQNGLASGGGIYNAGSLDMTNCWVNCNSADTYGAGIWNSGSTLTISSCTIVGNTSYQWGGGIYNFSGSVTINNSSVEGNYAVVAGAGIYNRATLNMQYSSLSGNQMTGQGGLLGGGIYIYSGTVSFYTVEIEGNSANTGGGFYLYSGDLTLTDCTLQDNSATNIGIGGAYNSGQLNSYQIIGGNIVDPIDRD